MKICPLIQSADAKEMRRQGELAFTMIEIALAIGVIGFALVAIIGVLPAGLNVQKDNREDTLVSQDAPYFLDAIRNGVVVSNTGSGNFGYYNTSKSLDFLTNYVTSIKFVHVINGSNQPPITYPNSTDHNLTGAEIIGLLSNPQVNYNSSDFASNYFDTVATVRALSGPATEQNGLNSIMAFTYQMEVMITPFNSFAYNATNFLNPSLDINQSNICYYRYLAANPGARFTPSSQPYSQSFMAATGGLQYNLFDVRLRFSWPVLANGNVGPGHQTYRTMIASPMVQATVNGDTNCWFFQPQVFAYGLPSGEL